MYLFDTVLNLDYLHHQEHIMIKYFIEALILQVITMCLAITLSATVALVLLFFPKIYVIVCKPERNNRSAFTTSKDVRCHIGSTSRSFPSHDSMNRYPMHATLLPTLTEQNIVYALWAFVADNSHNISLH